MKKFIKDIAVVQSGVFLRAEPEADVFYLQVSDFDAEGNYVNIGKPVVRFGPRIADHILKEGDLLFAAKGMSNFCVVYREEWGRMVASSSFLVIRLQAKETVLPDFLCWFLNLPQVMGRLKAMAVGSSILSISKKRIEETGIDLPGIEGQRKVVELAELQRKEQYLYQSIALKRKELSDQVLVQFIKTDGK